MLVELSFDQYSKRHASCVMRHKAYFDVSRLHFRGVLIGQQYQESGGNKVKLNVNVRDQVFESLD